MRITCVFPSGLRLGQGLPGEQSGYQQVPVLQNTKQGVLVGGVVYDDAEMDALAEIERIERESAIERERCSKEVQDKGVCVCVRVRRSEWVSV